jgi:hypothetical protein
MGPGGACHPDDLRAYPARQCGRRCLLEFHDYAFGNRELSRPEKNQRYLRILLLGLRDQVRDTLQITVQDVPDTR